MTTQQLTNNLHDAINLISNTPAHMWFTIGVVVASLPVTVAIVELIKRRHLKATAQEMTTHLIDFTVLVTGTLMTVADFVITQGANLQALSKFLPFLAVVLPTIKALAPSIYSYSKAVHGWFINRSTETQKQRFQAVMDSADAAIADQAAAGVLSAPGTQPLQPPSQDLLN